MKKDNLSIKEIADLMSQTFSALEAISYMDGEAMKKAVIYEEIQTAKRALNKAHRRANARLSQPAHPLNESRDELQNSY